MKRIKREILDLAKEEMGDLTLVPSERSIYDWAATIPGPSGSPYAGGTFNLQITLPQDYRASSPWPRITRVANADIVFLFLWVSHLRCLFLISVLRSKGRLYYSGLSSECFASGPYMRRRLEESMVASFVLVQGHAVHLKSPD